MAQPENVLLAAYIRGCLTTEQGFDFSARNEGMAAISSATGAYATFLEAKIKDYFVAHPQIAEIKGRTGKTGGAGIESANLYFFDAEGTQLKDPKMVWQEYRQESTGIVVTEDMLKQLEEWDGVTPLEEPKGS
jgi:hypothetical protein